MSQDKATQGYWKNLWDGRPCPTPVNPRTPGLGNFVERRYDALFRRAFEGQETQGARLVEFGCAGSQWLPYFALEFGCRVAGIDYTQNGCAQAEAVLARAGVGGEVYCRDFFELPGELAEAFDWGVSFGVAEHFQDTASCLEAFSRYLKPGAGLITTIPNLSGALGWLQKRADRAVYDIHVPLDREQLRAAHERAGFRVESCDYFLSANWSVLNFESWRDRRLQALGTRVRSYASKVFWLADEAGVGVSPNRLTSPYIVCIARKL